jgi:glycosyltransferase involved in cell wall biosynthesis
MKVFAEVLPTSLGRAMYRLNKNIKKYAPPHVVFVDNPKSADIQILDVIGKGSLEFLQCKRYVFYQHCYLSSDDASIENWSPLFRDAVMVATYMDLPRVMGYRDGEHNFNFYRTAYGADPEAFYKTSDAKVFTAITIGYVASTESIGEVYDAVKAAGGKQIHVGKNLGLGYNCKTVEGISDSELTKLYNQSLYVSGLRKMEGFEIPIIEGLLCGSRGICYNKDHYSHWFEDLVEYIEEDNYAEIGLYSDKTREQLVELFTKPYREVTDSEIEHVKEKFSWETITKAFWKRLEESL